MSKTPAQAAPPPPDWHVVKSFGLWEHGDDQGKLREPLAKLGRPAATRSRGSSPAATPEETDGDDDDEASPSPGDDDSTPGDPDDTPRPSDTP